MAESHSAAPRKRLCTLPQPSMCVPTVYPNHIIISVSKIAVGTVTCFTFFMSSALNSSPSVNMRNTMPSWPTVPMDFGSARNDPPQVCSLIRMPATR